MDPVTLGMAKADAAKKYAPRAGTEKRAFFSFGGQRNTDAVANDTNLRLPFRLPVTTTRWRLHATNYNVRDNIAYGTVNVNGAVVGPHALTATGTWTGQFSSVPTPQVGAFTLTGGDEYVSPWVTDPAQQIAAFTDMVLSLGFTNTAAQTNTASNARGFAVTGASNYNVAAPTMPAATSATPLNTWIEYEFVGSQPVGLFIGDSIADGYSAATGWAGQWPIIAANRSGGVACNVALSGSTAAMWATGTDRKWTRWDLSNMSIDYAVVALGANDIVPSGYSTTRANLLTIYAKLRSLGINRIYGATVTPQNAFTAPQNADRLNLNSYLRNGYGALAGVIDLDSAVANPASVDAIRADYDAGDGVHYVIKGQHRLASEASGILIPLSVALA